MKKILLSTALSVLFVTGCQTNNYTDSPMTQTANADSHQITEVQWQLIQLNGKEVKDNKSQEEQPYIFLHQKDRKVFGLAGCNYFFSSYKLKNNQLTFSQFGITMMACHDGPVPEHQFIQALENTDSYIIKGNQLTIRQGNKALAVFKASNPKKNHHPFKHR